jgi:hypothetical protein
MKPENNSIIKTFKESGAGGGQAGFIESMSFDWINNQTTWDVEPGRKAPKLCKITVEFSPIHDITPGLDSQGNNRAPVYRVAESKTSAEIDSKYDNPTGEIVPPKRGRILGADVSLPTLADAAGTPEELTEDKAARRKAKQLTDPMFVAQAVGPEGYSTTAGGYAYDLEEKAAAQEQQLQSAREQQAQYEAEAEAEIAADAARREKNAQDAIKEREDAIRRAAIPATSAELKAKIDSQIERARQRKYDERNSIRSR